MATRYDGDADRGSMEFGSPIETVGIQFQHGPVGDNGVQNEQVIELLVLRLRDLNSKFPCRENSIAITNLEQAQMWLEKRTSVRVGQGVEGKNLAHVS